MIRTLMPTVWRRSETPLRRAEPFFALEREMNEIFEDFYRTFELAPLGLSKEIEGFTPSIDVTEDDKTISVKAELPGMEEKDIEVNLTEDTLTLSGEKKEEKAEKEGSTLRRETRYGAFCRTIGVPKGIDPDKVEARFKNGVLTVTLNKPVEAQKETKKIAVKAE